MDRLRPPTMTDHLVKQLEKLTSFKILAGFGVLALVFTVAMSSKSWSGADPNDSLVFYNAVKTDLPISVIERGYLESQEQTKIECQVETYDRYNGGTGVTIIYIVPNGSVVEKGQLLVELDSTTIRDRLETEGLELESDRSTLLQAEARKKNQITQNRTRVAEASLALELAKLDREMYIDERSGAFKLAVEEIERQIDDTRNSILEAQAALKLQETEKAGIEELFRLGYKGKSDLDQSRFAFMKAEAALAAAVNRLSNHEASRRQLQTYEYKKELLRLDGAMATAQNNLNQVEVTNESELAQVNAQLFESRERVKRQEARVRQLEQQVEYCTIHAPNDGMVVYAFGDKRSEPIGEGSVVRQRQEILRLPDLTKMQVRTQIHEAVLDQVEAGQRVTVKVDAFSDRDYEGVVKEVAVVPSRNSNTNAKTYDCVVKIEGPVSQLKPGMTAVSEIHVDHLHDIISVPVQAIVQSDGKTGCYVENEDSIELCPVELGRNNDMYVQLVSGISPGARVVLNPKSVLTNQGKGPDPFDQVLDGVQQNDASISNVAVNRESNPQNGDAKSANTQIEATPNPNPNPNPNPKP